MARYPVPKAGQTVDAFKLKARSAQIDLASSPPTRGQALELTRALVSSWTGDLSDDRLDAISQIWLLFPLPVCAACVHPWTGIAAAKVKNPRTGQTEPRRFVPSNPEIRDWCNEYQADLYQIAKASELVGRPIEAPSLAPERAPPTPEEIASVWRVVDDIKERCNRIAGIPTAEELRDQVERYLQACRDGA